MKRDFENNLEKRIKDLLEKIWGSGKIVAMVTADLDFNQREVTRIIWGDEGVIASEQVIQRKDTTSLEEPFAVGQENREDLLYQEMLEDDEVLSAYIETIRNYEIDRTEEKEFYAPGRLLSLSTAVAVNGDLSIEQEEEIIEIVSAAIGFNTDRGDQINVISMDFDDSHLAEVEAEMERLAAEEKRKEQIENWISWGEKGLIILLAFILGIMLIRTLRKFLTDDVPDVQQPTPVREIEEQLEQVAQEKPDQKKEEKVKEIVEQEPEVAAQIINTWLEENEDGSGN
jgi:flagellar M-ring protein FliF